MKRKRTITIAVLAIVLSVSVITTVAVTQFGRIGVCLLAKGSGRSMALRMLLRKNDIGKNTLPDDFSYSSKDDEISHYGVADAEGTRYHVIEVLSKTWSARRDLTCQFVFTADGECILRGSETATIMGDDAGGLYDLTGDGNVEKVLAYGSKDGKGGNYDTVLEIWSLRANTANLLLKVAYKEFNTGDAKHEFVKPTIQYNQNGKSPSVTLAGGGFESLGTFHWFDQEARFIATPAQSEYWELLFPLE